MSAVLDRPKTIEPKTQNLVTEKQNISGKESAIERIILHNVSWETYNRLNEEQVDIAGLHFFYNEGDLEIMTESYKYGKYSSILSEIVLAVATEFEIDLVGAGSTTFKKEKKQKGFEGDASFYFKNAEQVRVKDEIDLSVDPAPELVLGIDITHDSLSKFPIFSGLGVEEVWRFDGEKVCFHRLHETEFKEISESVCLKGVKSKTVTELLFAAQKMKRMDWLKLIRDSIRR